MVRCQLSPQKPPGSRLGFSRAGVQHSPGSSTIELYSDLAESGAYPPDRALPGSPRQCHLPLACHHLPKGTKLELGRGAHLGNIILNQPYRRRVSTDRLNREDSQLAASLEGEPGPIPVRVAESFGGGGGGGLGDQICSRAWRHTVSAVGPIVSIVTNISEYIGEGCWEVFARREAVWTHDDCNSSGQELILKR